PVAQDSGFQGVAQDRIGNNKRQDRRNPSRQKNRKDDLETFETVAPSFRHCVSQLMPAGCENWPITVTLLAISGKRECREQKLNSKYGSVQSHEKIVRPWTIKEIARPFALSITKIERRLLCINIMRRRFSEANVRFLN